MKIYWKPRRNLYVCLEHFPFTKTDLLGWWYPVLIFTPDLSTTGYVVNPQIGAATYNFIHHKAVGISIFVLGMMLATSLCNWQA
ncbi:DUF4260 family protein [Candidatus Villigracilis affinis]|uniref:DUF4260 family protein n=1 Tax=Candidatus Villigracilis affinis TaxID=3140682 RepID=UPI0031E6383B